MRLHALALLLGIIVGFGGYTAFASPTPAPDPAQQNYDVYQCCNLPGVKAGWTDGDLSTLNPLTNKLRAGSRSVTWRWVEVCASGNMKDTLRTALADTTEVTGITFTEVTGAADVTVRATCGTDATNAGLGAAVCDLYPGWPYQSTINCLTTMQTFYELSQVSIWEHEFAGHGLGTWNEQYQLDGNFSSTPGLQDFMNTGPLSRYSWPQNDIDRWERVMYQLTQATPHWSFDVCASSWQGWHNSVAHIWVHAGTSIYLDGFGIWVTAPASC